MLTKESHRLKKAEFYEIFTHSGVAKHFYIEGGGTNFFASRGGGDKHFFVGGSGAYDDVDEEMVEFLVAHRAMKF